MQEQQREQIARAYRDQEAARLGIDWPEKVIPVVVPANLRCMVNLPERRKRAFRDRLMQLLGQAAALRASSVNRTSGDGAQTPSATWPLMPETLLARGCSICRGRCCNAGQDHAYVDVATLESYMQRRPNLRPRHVLADYLSRLPNKAYEESCVYHTEKGCNLPHEMRSLTCRDFYCTELWRFQRQFAREALRQVIYLAAEGLRMIRAESLEAGRTGPS